MRCVVLCVQVAEPAGVVPGQPAAAAHPLQHPPSAAQLPGQQPPQGRHRHHHRHAVHGAQLHPGEGIPDWRAV